MLLALGVFDSFGWNIVLAVVWCVVIAGLTALSWVATRKHPRGGSLTLRLMIVVALVPVALLGVASAVFKYQQASAREAVEQVGGTIDFWEASTRVYLSDPAIGDGELIELIPDLARFPRLVIEAAGSTVSRDGARRFEEAVPGSQVRLIEI
jgi:hypothetical protein